MPEHEEDSDGLLEHLKSLSLNQDKEIKLLKSRLRKMEITIIGTISLLQRQIDEYRDDPELLNKRIILLDALVEKKR